MANILLFHSALGLRPSVLDWAATLREDGHTVHSPDLFEGAVFDNLEAGIAHRDAVGIPELTRRGSAAAEALPADLVYLGFSMGAAAAQFLALTRPGARGVVLMHGALPPQAFGVAEWPAALPAQIHGAQGDPYLDWPVARALRDSAPAGRVALFTYPGAAHLFADAEGTESDPEAASLMRARVRSFLKAL